MAEMMETLKNLLGDDAEEKINSVVNMLNSEKSTTESTPSLSDTDISAPELMLQAQGLLSKLSNVSDNRSKLLMSLKPYMRENRQKTIDSAVKILNMAQFSELFKGGI